MSGGRFSATGDEDNSAAKADFERSIYEMTDKEDRQAAQSASGERDLLREEVANITKRLSNGWQALLRPGEEEQANAMEIQTMREAKLLIEDLYGMVCRTRSETKESFQQRVDAFMLSCFGEKVAADMDERCHRFLEESLELVQAIGIPVEHARMLVEYVYARPKGEAHQETGGVMLTLAALCSAAHESMERCGEDELARVWTKIDVIREKQKSKPRGSPLPIPHTAQGDAKIDREWWKAQGIDACIDRMVLINERAEDAEWKAAHRLEMYNQREQLIRDLQTAAMRTQSQSGAPSPVDIAERDRVQFIAESIEGVLDAGNTFCQFEQREPRIKFMSDADWRKVVEVLRAFAPSATGESK